jgi:hypothetical protein
MPFLGLSHDHDNESPTATGGKRVYGTHLLAHAQSANPHNMNKNAMIFATYRIYNKCRASCSHSTQTTLVVLLKRAVEGDWEGS